MQRGGQLDRVVATQRVTHDELRHDGKHRRAQLDHLQAREVERQPRQDGVALRFGDGSHTRRSCNCRRELRVRTRTRVEARVAQVTAVAKR
jgi:hypothetical protein